MPKDPLSSLLSMFSCTCAPGDSSQSLLLTLAETENKSTPLSYLTHFNLGSTLHSGLNYDGAIKCYRDSIRLNPNYAPSYYNLATALQELGDLQQAKEAYERCIELSPTSMAYYNLGYINQDLNLLPLSITNFQSAVTLAPNDPDCHINLGNGYRQSGGSLLPLAIKSYMKALDIDNSNVMALYNLGSVYLDMGSLSESVDFFKKALEFDPLWSDAHYNLGIAYQDLGEYEKSLKCYENAVKTEEGEGGGEAKMAFEEMRRIVEREKGRRDGNGKENAVGSRKAGGGKSKGVAEKNSNSRKFGTARQV